jgi:hypothetical protein
VGKSPCELRQKAQFTTKLHFFALYQQKADLQTCKEEIFTMKSTT